MPDVADIARAIEFIENHLDEEIAVADIADAVSFSLFHFCRSFNQATHHTPYNYLMRRRLSKSALELVRTDIKIIDIAFNMQFNNAETFSRAFKRMFGEQPTQIRQRGFIDRRRLMPRLSLAHLNFIESGICLTPKPLTRDAFQLTGIMTRVKDNPTNITDLWEQFFLELSTHEPNSQPSGYYGITYYAQEWETRGQFYFAAAEMDQPENSRGPWVQKTISRCECARFDHNGDRQTFELLLDYVNHTWLPRSGRCQPLPFIIEKFTTIPQYAQEEAYTAELWVGW